MVCPLVLKKLVTNMVWWLNNLVNLIEAFVYVVSPP
jgi:hypothetical protein